MKYVAEVKIEKSFYIKFPEDIFTDEHMADVRSYSLSNADLDVDALKEKIAEYYALYGHGYAEPYGVDISYGSYSDAVGTTVIVRETEEDIDSICMELV